MDHASFAFVCDEIRDHPVFYNDSNHSQAPVDYQLLVALAHLGLNGNGGSPHILAQFFNISGELNVFQYLSGNNDADYLHCLQRGQSKTILIVA